MEEAKALGMGPEQATLDEIFASYTKFLKEADTERIAAEKAAAEKAEQQLHLGELLPNSRPSSMPAKLQPRQTA